ncbi:hypothetical protein [Mycobacteroides chelonae]|uniref:hypothetical protein n=1 Tax=Mycobacteroides chelonae TaxID=1774 RepID=UPI0012FF8A07|nr:hypothetical protein [Mycobacteroides chelonae]
MGITVLRRTHGYTVTADNTTIELTEQDTEDLHEAITTAMSSEPATTPAKAKMVRHRLL